MDKDLVKMIAEIQSDLQAIEENETLYEETNFNSRADAIDFLDFHILDRMEGLPQNEELEAIKQRAQNLKCKLEKTDANLFKQFRKKIRTGKPFFKRSVHQYLEPYFKEAREPDQADYDNLDLFINGLLSDQAIPLPALNREPEMVFYQKTPARIVFEMVELMKPKPGDIFFDLGSGLGQVSILVNLISGTVTKGIEYEPAYCNYAKACAAQLNLLDVEFININALEGNYSQGTIFFLYTPFEGAMLRDMLEILRKESLKRPIRIFSYGRCSFQLVQQHWLHCVNGTGDRLYKLYEFVSADAAP